MGKISYGNQEAVVGLQLSALDQFRLNLLVDSGFQKDGFRIIETPINVFR